MRKNPTLVSKPGPPNFCNFVPCERDNQYQQFLRNSTRINISQNVEANLVLLGEVRGDWEEDVNTITYRHVIIMGPMWSVQVRKKNLVFKGKSFFQCRKNIGAMVDFLMNMIKRTCKKKEERVGVRILESWSRIFGQANFQFPIMYMHKNGLKKGMVLLLCRNTRGSKRNKNRKK